jgi:glucose-1-phosphate thymidylyltransferase
MHPTNAVGAAALARAAHILARAGRCWLMKVSDAVLLARRSDDWGAWPSLGFRARQLAPVANKPILFHALERLERAGVRRVAMIVDEETRPEIAAAVGDGARWGTEVRYVDGVPGMLATALTAAREHLGDPPYLLQDGDVIMQRTLGEIGRHFSAARLDALVLRHGAGPLPRRGYIVGSEAADALCAAAPAGPVGEVERVLGRLRGAGGRVGVLDVEACTPCRGGQDALLEANRRLLDEMAAGAVPTSGRVQGRAWIHESARVLRSVVRGPAVIGPEADIRDAYVGPYTSIGARAVIEGAEIENSIVLDEASMHFLPSRIEGSVIGRGARIGVDFRLPRSMRLSVGEHAVVTLH